MTQAATGQRNKQALGKFITFEGGEGAGKSTQARILAERLAKAGIKVLLTREPGGTKRAEAIRKLVLEGRVKQFGPLAEAVMFSLARHDHLERIIRPSLARGIWVISDRFSDSTRAYQGAGGKLDIDLIEGLERVVVGRTRPQLTIILDQPPERGLARVRARQAEQGGNAGQPDRFEDGEDIGFHQTLRHEFLTIAAENPLRYEVVNADQPPDKVAADIWHTVVQRFRTNG